MGAKRRGKRNHRETRRFSILEVPGNLSENSVGGAVKRKTWLGWAQENGMEVPGK